MQEARLQAALIDMADVHKLRTSWLPVSIAPSDADLEVCVLDKDGFHALVFPVRKSGTSWIDTKTKKPVDIVPTHWRKWGEGR
jgi:hypothetical protein